MPTPHDAPRVIAEVVWHGVPDPDDRHHRLLRLLFAPPAADTETTRPESAPGGIHVAA